MPLIFLSRRGACLNKNRLRNTFLAIAIIKTSSFKFEGCTKADSVNDELHVEQFTFSFELVFVAVMVIVFLADFLGMIGLDLVDAVLALLPNENLPLSAALGVAAAKFCSC
jgi:hypothetical protein